MRLPSSVPRFSIRLPRSLCRKAIKSPSSPCLPVTWSDSAEWSPLTASNCTAWLWRALSKFLCKSAMRCPSPASSLSTVAQRWSQACVPSFISSSLALVAVRAEVVRSTAAVRPFIAVSRLSSTSRCCSCASPKVASSSAKPFCALKRSLTSSVCLSAKAINELSRLSTRSLMEDMSLLRTPCRSTSSWAQRWCSLSACCMRSADSCLSSSLTISKHLCISSFNAWWSCSAIAETPATKSENLPCKEFVNWCSFCVFAWPHAACWPAGSLRSPRTDRPPSSEIEARVPSAKEARMRVERTGISSSPALLWW
mmetsp:Transcript_70630/g.195188  ORF Transcript_70630/g.195188 Transcript_70630/m.195188 type:complete len:311 (-) Transcript_70630:73-1005(-)